MLPMAHPQEPLTLSLRAAHAGDRQAADRVYEALYPDRDGLNATSGKLVAANTSGSATGSGPVLIENGGTLPAAASSPAR